MATQQSFLVCDSSTLANFKNWAQTISTWFSTAGWVQSADSGQVNWSTIASVPGSAAFVYEIWEPNDSLTNFYVKMEYGNVSGTNCPSLRITLSTGTNGAGTSTGSIVGPLNTNPTSFTPPSTSTTYECDFTGAAGRIGAMMWRNGTNNCQQLFAIERSNNGLSGGSFAYTGTYVTLWVSGWNESYSSNCYQRSLYFGVGAAPLYEGWNLRVPSISINGTSNTASFNGSIPFDTASPSVGFIDFTGTSVGAGASADFSEGVTFTVTLYGGTRTYMPSKNGPFSWNPTPPGNSSYINSCIAMRYD